MDPADVREQLSQEAREALGIVATGRPMRLIGAEMELLSRLSQGLAVCNLLGSLDTEAFRVNLLRSVHARCHFLRKSAEQGNTDDRRLALSRTESLFDALAAGHPAALQTLLGLSRTPYHAGWEYQDDHIYHRCVVDLAGGADTQAAAAARDYRRAAAEVAPGRGRVLQALLARDSEGFSEALTVLMEEIDVANQARQARLLEPDLEACLHWPRCFVSVEGLGLIALARQRGIPIMVAVPLCPGPARLPEDTTDTENFFDGIDRELAAGGA